MQGSFDDGLLAQWCELYVRFVSKDQHHLAKVVSGCDKVKLQTYLLSGSMSIVELLAKTKLTDEDYLAAYGCLQNLDDKFWQKPHPHLLNGFVEQYINSSRYILTRLNEHPIFRAISEKKRFKLSGSLGDKGVLQFRHQWQEVEHSAEIEMCRSAVFDVFTQNQTHVKIGFSPFAGIADMSWQSDATDTRGSDGRIPFWGAGAKDKANLLKRLEDVLSAACEQHVHILLLPELVMTEALQDFVSNWLLERNDFNPIIRLLIAGTRHVFDTNKNNSYSNRCTVFNAFGGIEWEQEKRQPFVLLADEAVKLFGVQMPAFEPTEQSERLVMRHTALGTMASPICLDFIEDEQWRRMPVNVFFVPAMSPNLSRFKDRCRGLGNARGTASFVCNALPGNEEKSVFAYRPAKDDLKPEQQSPFLFTVVVDIDMNYI